MDRYRLPALVRYPCLYEKPSEPIWCCWLKECKQTCTTRGGLARELDYIMTHAPNYSLTRINISSSLTRYPGLRDFVLVRRWDVLEDHEKQQYDLGYLMLKVGMVQFRGRFLANTLNCTLSMSGESTLTCRKGSSLRLMELSLSCPVIRRSSGPRVCMPTISYHHIALRFCSLRRFQIDANLHWMY